MIYIYIYISAKTTRLILPQLFIARIVCIKYQSISLISFDSKDNVSRLKSMYCVR